MKCTIEVPLESLKNTKFCYAYATDVTRNSNYCVGLLVFVVWASGTSVPSGAIVLSTMKSANESAAKGSAAKYVLEVDGCVAMPSSIEVVEETCESHAC